MKLNNKGFSLVELMLAVVVSTIVFGAITALIAFSSRSMRDTEARIEVQNQAKDAMNHMESYALEAERAYWDDSNHLLILFYDEKQAKEMISGLEDHTKSLSDIKDMDSDSFAYWYDDGSIYFGKCSSQSSSPGATPTPPASPIPGATPTPAPTADPTVQIVDVAQLSTISDSTLRNYLLADNTVEFVCKVNQNSESKKYDVDIQMKFDDEIAPEYSCGKRVYLRNQ